CPPARIDRELHEVGEALDPLGAGRRAALQRAKLIKVDWISTFRLQVCVDKVEVREFVLGVVMDILRHISIKIRKCASIGFVSGPSRNLLVLDSSKLIVLLPQIGFEDFKCGKKAENAHVSKCKFAIRQC